MFVCGCVCVCVCVCVKKLNFAPTYASIFMDETETNFLDTQEFNLLVWFRYIDYVFFILTQGKEKLEEFLKIFQ